MMITSKGHFDETAFIGILGAVTQQRTNTGDLHRPQDVDPVDRVRTLQNQQEETEDGRDPARQHLRRDAST